MKHGNNHTSLVTLFLLFVALVVLFVANTVLTF
jgi:hypothetical protein